MEKKILTTLVYKNERIFKKNILITGGTGTFGKAFIHYLNNLKYKPSKICIYARDEHKFHDLENSNLFKKNVRLFIGDVRDKKDLNLQLAVWILWCMLLL